LSLPVLLLKGRGNPVKCLNQEQTQQANLPAYLHTNPLNAERQAEKL